MQKYLLRFGLLLCFSFCANIVSAVELDNSGLFNLLKKEINKESGLVVGNCTITKDVITQVALNNEFYFDVKVKREKGSSSYGNIYFKNPSDTETELKLEKVNQWDWSTTDNLGKDRFRFLYIPGLGNTNNPTTIREVVIEINQEDSTIQSVKVHQYKFRRAILDLNQSVLDMINSSTLVDC